MMGLDTGTEREYLGLRSVNTCAEWKCAMSEERRQFPRNHVLRRGQVVFRNGHSAIECIVLDLSMGGARLRVADWLGLPPQFELRLEHGPARAAEVRYRDMTSTGVRFVESAAA
jgi:hypothetical protein